MKNKSVASARTRPQEIEDHQGRASRQKALLCNTNSEQGNEDRRKGGEDGDERANELGIHLMPVA